MADTRPYDKNLQRRLQTQGIAVAASLELARELYTRDTVGSPDGSRWKINVSNAGVITATKVS